MKEVVVVVDGVVVAAVTLDGTFVDGILIPPTWNASMGTMTRNVDSIAVVVTMAVTTCLML